MRSWIEYFACAATCSEIAFVVDGWSGWNNKRRLDVHVGDVNSFHNVAVKRCDALMNQDQSIRSWS